MSFHDQAFTRAQLGRVSPWAFEQLAEIDAGDVRSAVLAVAGNTNPAQPIHVWTRAVERCHSPIWRAIDAQG